MEFHLEFTPKPFSEKIRHSDKLLLIGSCFTEQIGTKLSNHKFNTLDNPNGILFNPISISKSLQSYIGNKPYTATDLFYQNESWNSWEHHSRFSHPDQEICLSGINASREEAHEFLKNADWLLITLGSAFVYELQNKDVVANCHKVPTDKFNKRLLSVNEVVTAMETVHDQLSVANNQLRTIYTISPVRHLRDGFVENNRSKATLHLAVQQLTQQPGRYYFPAFELVMDDLRDYRFYAEDMVHPNYAATNYVWKKFISTCIDADSQVLMEEINRINAAKSHKAFNPTSEQHKKFLKANLEKVLKLKEEHSYINFEEEIKYFG